MQLSLLRLSPRGRSLQPRYGDRARLTSLWVCIVSQVRTTACVKLPVRVDEMDSDGVAFNIELRSKGVSFVG